ncbi:MAG: enoyl-CoA hydratase-related protein [Candidatus Binataceae bacterium]|jgi:2-(1,2-epoxy-1,2-dihydrophenyl)acetyl-CoA isomerase
MESINTLLFEVRDHVAYITLNRPEAANAMNLELSRELEEVALECEENINVRAVLLTGAGKMFCGGGDVKAFAAQEPTHLPAYLKRVTLYLHQAIHRFARMRAPVVMAVNGSAGGGGMSLACAGDIVLAGESARFTMAYTRIGLTPDGSSTYYLPRIIGLRRTMELALTNRTLSAREAEAIGLVTRVVPDDQLIAQAEALGNELAHGPTRAYGGVKRLLYGSFNTPLHEQMELESEWIADMARTWDAQEGMAAFVGKRTPKFNGQ